MTTYTNNMSNDKEYKVTDCVVFVENPNFSHPYLLLLSIIICAVWN